MGMGNSFETPYLFALTNPGNEDLLKESVKLSGLGLVPSFSHSGFVSFKKKGGLVTCDDHNNFPFAYARLVGADAGMLDKGQAAPTSYFDLEAQEQVGVPSGSELFFKLKSDSYWSCSLEKTRGLLGHIYGTPKLTRPESAPSRAYLKIAESFELAHIQRLKIKRVIELGCAPGGASIHLLDRGFEVYGVDPAVVDSVVLENPNFHYLNLPVQEVTRDNLPGDFQLLASDMNLNPSQTVAFSIKIIEQLRRRPELLLITLKTPDTKWIASLPKLARKFKSLGYGYTAFAQLPTHRRETLLYCLRGRS